jgi:hypothetical protein
VIRSDPIPRKRLLRRRDVEMTVADHLADQALKLILNLSIPLRLDRSPRLRPEIGKSSEPPRQARSAANAKRPIRGLDLVGPVVLRAGSKSEGAAGRFHSNAPDRFVWVVDELIKPNARFWTYAEIGVVVKSQTRHTTVSGVNQPFE